MKLDLKFFTVLKEIITSMDKTQYVSIIESEKTSYLAPEIRIGMWGQFSCGKSSFINALIGRKLLPVNILELTSMVTEVVYGETEQIILNPDEENLVLDYSEEMATIAMAGIVSWDDLKPSMRSTLKVDQFNICLSEFNKLKNGISKVRLTSPAPILKNGVIFVDLPGLSGSDDHSKLSSGKINECEMILYLNAPSRPIDAHDWEVIKKLKCDGKRRVVFGVRTKSDDLFKNHYAENNSDLSDEERYAIFLQEFKNEIKDVPFDGYFLVSPLAFSAISEAGNNYSLAINNLKEEHKNKFRFLNEKSRIEIISGHKFFTENFERIIESKRDEAKMRKASSSIKALLARISQEIHQDWEVLCSNKRMDESELVQAKETLEKIKSKFHPLKDISNRYNDLIDFQLRSFVNELCFENMKNSFQGINLDRSYDSPEHVISTINIQFQKELQNSLDKKVNQDRIQNIGKSALEDYRDSLVEIEDLLDKFDCELLKEKHAVQSLEKINLEKFDLKVNRDIDDIAAPGYMGSIAGGLLGGFIIDSSMGLIMESVMGAFAGFGLGTILIGASKGILNGRGVVNGIMDGLSDFLNGIFALFGSESAKAGLLCNSLKTINAQNEFAKKLSGQVSGSIHGALKTVLVDKVTTTLAKQNTIELMWNRFETEAKKLNTIYSNKGRDLSQREAALQSLLAMEKSYTALLSEYELGEVKLKKTA